MNLKQIIEASDKEFDEKVNILRQQLPDLNTETEAFEFGYKKNVNDTLYTIPDWGNIKKFLRDRNRKILEGIKEMIGEYNARILNAFQLQGKADQPMIAYDERVNLIPAIEIAMKETISLINSALEN